MKVKTSIGEVGLTIGEREYLLRPSFLSMSTIGDDETLVNAANAINLAKQRLLTDPERITVLDISTAIFIIQCCCDVEIEELGHIVGSEWSGQLYYREGDISGHDLIIIAEHLIRYGINGVETKRTKISERFSDKRDKFVFKINEFVASAIAHLKLSSKDAWNLTMPEFQLAVDALFPEDPKKANMPTQDEVEESFRKVREARARYEKMQQDKPPKKQKPSRQRY
jgi:hypothetical protein